MSNILPTAPGLYTVAADNCSIPHAPLFTLTAWGEWRNVADWSDDGVEDMLKRATEWELRPLAIAGI